MTPVLVLVSGPPGAGKTTLAKRLGHELGLPVFDRDDLKDTMFESLGWSDRAWSMKVGAASYELLYLVIERLLASGVCLVAETNFRRPYSADRLSKVLQVTRARVIEIHCSAPPDLLLRRYRDRWESGGRHPGHVSDTLLEQAALGANLEAEHRALALGAVVEVDTSDFERIDWNRIVTTLREALDGSEDR